MRYCFDDLKRVNPIMLAKWRSECLWHFKYIWVPKIISLDDQNGRSCLVWLEYVQRKSIDTFNLWNDYPLQREYVYRLDPHRGK